MPVTRVTCTAPRHVYAGMISNRTTKPVLCTIYYSTGADNKFEESISVTLDSGGRACIPEREYRPTSEATFTCRKIIARIDAQTNGQVMSLEQPFDGVTAPMTDWRFDIYDQHIMSMNPNA